MFMTNVQSLEQHALDAHRLGVRFVDLWKRIERDVRAAAGNYRKQFAKLYHKLLMLAVSGDTEGQRPPESDAMPWDVDDSESKPCETHTEARYIGIGR
jgi:hypothetical protein